MFREVRLPARPIPDLPWNMPVWMDHIQTVSPETLRPQAETGEQSRNSGHGASPDRICPEIDFRRKKFRIFQYYTITVEQKEEKPVALSADRRPW